MALPDETRYAGHAIDCKLSLGGKFCTCGYHKLDRLSKAKKLRRPCSKCGQPVRDGEIHECPGTPPKRLNFKQKMDGTSWMVSVIGPDEDEGSAWYSERGGGNPLEAAQSYMQDDASDNPGAAAIRDHPEEVIIVVIDQQIAPSGKQWHVHLFCLENGKLRRFP
jgi:hypothetical protein